MDWAIAFTSWGIATVLNIDYTLARYAAQC